MYVTGVGTAVPRGGTPSANAGRSSAARRITGTWRAGPPAARPRAARRARRETRHLALEHLGDALEIDPDVLYRRFLTHAPALATRAARTRSQEAGLGARSRRGPHQHLHRLPVSRADELRRRAPRPARRRARARPRRPGLRRGAAEPAHRARPARGSCEHVLSICVEICSAAMYLDDDPGVLISACLFGDGAAAAVGSKKS